MRKTYCKDSFFVQIRLAANHLRTGNITVFVNEIKVTVLFLNANLCNLLRFPAFLLTTVSHLRT